MREQLEKLFLENDMGDDFRLSRYMKKCLDCYFEKGIHFFIIKTSNLGYDCGVYRFETTLPLGKFKEIDSKYGMKYRHQSTTIDQLKAGAETEGYNFSFEEIIKPNGTFNPGSRKYTEDYFANSGNY